MQVLYWAKSPLDGVRWTINDGCYYIAAIAPGYTRVSENSNSGLIRPRYGRAERPG